MKTNDWLIRDISPKKLQREKEKALRTARKELNRKMAKELKPCKYCGGKAELVMVGDNKEFFAYRCSCCGEYHGRLGDARLTPWGAKRVWNRRADNE